MTVDTSVKKVTAPGDGSAVEFSYDPLVIFESSQLSVWHVDAAGAQTLLVEGSGSSNYELFPKTFPVGGATGHIVYPADRSTPMPVGEQLVMKRTMPGTQDLDLVNQGAYYPDTLEAALDSNLMNTLDTREKSERALRVQIGDTGVDAELPTVKGSAGAYVRLNDAEDGFVWSALAVTSGSASDATPQPVEYGQPGDAGTSPDYSRSDHVHAMADDPHWESVTDYGATGDGTTDDRAAIAAADTDATTSGKPVYFPPGTYRVASDLTIANDVVLEAGARVKVDTGVKVTFSGQVSGSDHYRFELVGSGEVALNRKLNGTVSPLWFGSTVNEVTIQNAINVASANDGTQQGGVVELPPGFHDIDTSAGPLTISNPVTMRGAGYGPASGTGQSGGTVLRNTHQANHVISVTAVGFVLLTDFGIDAPGVTKNSGTAGIHVNEASTGGNQNKKIIERLRINHMYHGIHIEDAHFPTIRDCLIISFTFIGVFLEQNTSADTDVGLVENCRLWDVSGTSGARACIDWRNGAVRIINNRMLGTDYGFVGLFSNTGSNSGPVFILDNMIERQKDYGVWFTRSAAATTAGTIIGHLVIQGNHFQGIDAGHLNHMLISGSSSNWVNAVSIDGNVFQNTLATLTSNNIISINDGDNVVVSNNILQNESGGDGGISTAGNSINVLVADNQITGGTTANKYPFLNSSTTLKDNVGVQFADLRNVADGSQVFVTDGTAGTPLTGGGSGSMAFRINGAWKGI